MLQWAHFIDDMATDGMTNLCIYIENYILHQKVYFILTKTYGHWRQKKNWLKPCFQWLIRNANIVAAFRGMHVSPAKPSFGKFDRKVWQTDRQTDGRTDRQTDDGQSDPYVSLCFAGDTIKRNKTDIHLRIIPSQSWPYLRPNDQTFIRVPSLKTNSLF